MLQHILRSTFVLITLVSAAACGGETAAQPQAGGPPPAGVELTTLETRPIDDSSEFLATIRSLRSTTIQPEVEGFVTRIFVKAGDRVKPGDPLVQIDPDRQQASVRSAEANRAGTEADVKYWREHVKRLEALLEAGAISRQEYDQAATSLRSAEARLAALDAQVREGRVQLQYYRVTAPQAGIVGDIPIRAGDRVTTSSVITTIDQNESLEAYIQVPLERAPDLREGLRVELLDRDGKVMMTSRITFVAPRVDEATQSVLAKSALSNPPESFRVLQFVRARIVWDTVEGITVPVVAVSRISGQYFCFVAEQQGEGLVARQRAIRVGEVIGNDYVVLEGLNPGDRVVVSGIQKIADGAPIRAE